MHLRPSRWLLRVSAIKALTIACERCGAEAVIGDDIPITVPYEVFVCPAGSGNRAAYKYEQAPTCPGCGREGDYNAYNYRTMGGCCSRVCQLQTEYADALIEIRTLQESGYLPSSTVADRPRRSEHPEG